MILLLETGLSDTARRQVLCIRIEAKPLKDLKISHNPCTKLDGGQYIYRLLNIIN